MIQQDAVADILWQDVAMIARKYASAFERMAGIKDARNTVRNRPDTVTEPCVLALTTCGHAAIAENDGGVAGRDVLAALRATVLRHP
jgi:hypothetical protein